MSQQLPQQPTDSGARITVIGDALIDELRDPSGAREFVGGAALNVAVGLALLGEQATLIAMVGDDEPGDRIRSYLRDYRVGLIESPSPLGTSRAISDRTEGEPRYEFNEAAKRRGIRFGDAVRSAIDEADLVVVSCFPFDDDAQYAALVEAIDDPGRRVIVDGNPRAGMLADRARFLANFEDFASRSLLVKVGDEDAELLLRGSLEVFVERLRSAGARAVLATA
ncbi:carbohydrate kinase family protein, partial [Streptomyces sp. NPDC058650]|uniref:carbohydrate kinase family protein n=1 Tax=Streptomyces sp. NPDC058650 TaxID=3346575 RepID=UPI00364B2090